MYTVPDHPAAVVERLGDRIRTLREHRGLTLADLAEATGISTSTLSRLENRQRRATLEILLALARVFAVPLDELVGAPDTGDPRISLKPKLVNGRVVVPLSRVPAAVQAWKILVPTTDRTPAVRAHDGREWLYVLSGRLRLILGERDLVLGVGEAVEFDTRVPHWFGSTGDGPAEILSLFGVHGARVHLHGPVEPPDEKRP